MTVWGDTAEAQANPQGEWYPSASPVPWAPPPQLRGNRGKRGYDPEKFGGHCYRASLLTVPPLRDVCLWTCWLSPSPQFNNNSTTFLILHTSSLVPLWFRWSPSFLYRLLLSPVPNTSKTLLPTLGAHLHTEPLQFYLALCVELEALQRMLP